MSPSRVEHPALAVLADPCPRLNAFGVAAFGQNDAIRIVFGMNIGFVPAFDWLETSSDRVIGVDQRFTEHTSFVALELRADQLDVLR